MKQNLFVETANLEMFSFFISSFLFKCLLLSFSPPSSVLPSVNRDVSISTNERNLQHSSRTFFLCRNLGRTLDIWESTYCATYTHFHMEGLIAARLHHKRC